MGILIRKIFISGLKIINHQPSRKFFYCYCLTDYNNSFVIRIYLGTDNWATQFEMGAELVGRKHYETSTIKKTAKINIYGKFPGIFFFFFGSHH